ncbi:hypothetical protein V1517DRAFT_318258 [Lipomyces orientalis]|uniref:Uncharacterized protein n=1 Tax=Lipomyces orientalis TaxID=1233043 RepID=A0ACC3TSQ0_9ASCO
MSRVRCARMFATATGRLPSRPPDVVNREKWMEMMGIFARNALPQPAMTRIVAEVWPSTVAPLAPVVPGLLAETATSADYARIVSLLLYAANAGSCEHVWLLFSSLDSCSQAGIFKPLVDELCRRHMPATALGLLANALSTSANKSFTETIAAAVDITILAAVKNPDSERLLLDFLAAIDTLPFAFGRQTRELLATTISHRNYRRLLYELSRLRQPLSGAEYVPIILTLCRRHEDLIFLVNLGHYHVPPPARSRGPLSNHWEPCVFRPSVYPEIIDRLVRIDHPSDATFFFQQLTRARPLTINLFNLLAVSALRLRRIDIAHALCRAAVAKLRDEPNDANVDDVSLMTYSVILYRYKLSNQIDSAYRMIHKIVNSGLPLDPVIATQYFDMVATSYKPAQVIKTYVAMFGSYPLVELGLDNYIDPDTPNQHDADQFEPELELPLQQPTAITLAILLRCIITRTMYMPHLLTLQQNIKAFVNSGGLDKLDPKDPDDPIGSARRTSDVDMFNKMMSNCIRQHKAHLRAYIAQSDLEN